MGEVYLLFSNPKIVCNENQDYPFFTSYQPNYSMEFYNF